MEKMFRQFYFQKNGICDFIYLFFQALLPLSQKLVLYKI